MSAPSDPVAGVKVVVFAPYYPPAYRAGGPVKSISQLVRSPANPFHTLVVSRDWDLGDASPLFQEANTWVDTGHERLWAFGHGLRPYLRSLLAVARQKPNIVYVNSLFDPWTGAVPALLWRMLGVGSGTLVVAPRGEMSAVALAKSARRKRLVLPCWRWIVRDERVVMHAASDQERQDIEKVLGEVRVVVRPNEVGPLLPPLKGPEGASEVSAVFLGRIAPIKGLLEMLESLQSVRFPLVLDIFGPAEDEPYLALCREAVARLPSTVRVTFRGPLASDEVRSRLAEYDVMLNPTRSESFGQAIGESLSAGTPVAVAPVTPWTSWIEASNGGTIVRDGRWANAAQALSRMGATGRRQMREGARDAYEAWWRDAQGWPHVFEMVLSRQP